MIHLREFAIEGSAVKWVACEKCSQRYAYLLNRQMRIATLPVPAFMRRQKEVYGKILQRQIADGVEPVSCPGCGWVQAGMMEELKRRTLRPLKKCGAFLAIASSALGMLFLGMGIYYHFHPSAGDLDCFGIAGAAAVGVLLGVLLMTLRWFVSMLRYDGGGFSSKRPMGADYLVLERKAA